MKRKGERREKGEKPDGKWCACTPQGHWGQTSRYVASQPLEKASGTQCLERGRATDAPNQAAKFSNKKNGCRIQPFFTLLARLPDICLGETTAEALLGNERYICDQPSFGIDLKSPR